MTQFNKFSHNVYSQNGEDGIIQEVLRRIQLNFLLSKWVVEFGAWDGKHLSNTFLLIEKGYRAVLIESDYNRFKDLKKTAGQFSKIIALNNDVARFPDSPNSIDNILRTTNIPADFDLLSIEIDSYDLDCW